MVPVSYNKLQCNFLCRGKSGLLKGRVFTISLGVGKVSRILMSTENLTLLKIERIGSYGEFENTDDAPIIRMNSIAVFTVGALFIVIASNSKE